MAERRKKIVIRLTESQKKVLERAIGRNVKALMIKPDNLYFVPHMESDSGDGLLMAHASVAAGVGP